MFEVPMSSTMSTMLKRIVLKPESYTSRMARNGMKTENSMEIDLKCPLAVTKTECQEVNPRTINDMGNDT